MVRGGDPAEYGGFLGTLASIAVPLDIDLVSKLFGKRMQVNPLLLRPARYRRHRAKENACIYALRPSPTLGMITWKKKTKVQRRSSFQY